MPASIGTCIVDIVVAQTIAMDIKLIRAFIASPSGLEDERRAAFAAAGEINKSVAVPMGGRLELIGWEETLSGNDRPQALINAEMESCDLFIGAMWTSWGSRPSLDGSYTSGFEEEFELSRSRHERSGVPAMSMFFKAIDPIQLRDPGVDLRKVLDFQEKLRAEKRFLYGTFNHAEEFASKVREFLSTHVIRLLKQPAAQRQEKAAEPKTKIGEEVEAIADPSTHRAPDASFLASASMSMLSEKSLGTVDVARIRLIGAAYGRATNDKQVLGVHDANLLYGSRKSFELSFSERYGLLEAGLAQIGSENTPVWTWLAGLTAEQPDVLVRLGQFAEPPTQAGAISAIRVLRLSVADILKFGEHTIGHWLDTSSDATVKKAALKLLREIGGPDELALVEEELNRADKDTSNAALEAAVTIMLRRSGGAAVRYILTTSFENLDIDLLHGVLGYVSEASVQELVTGLDHRSAEVRSAVLREMSKRDVVDIATLGRAKEDDAAIVRYAALQALDRIGQPTSLDEAHIILSTPRPNYGVFGLTSSQDSTGLALFQIYASERMRSMPPVALEALLASPIHRVVAYQTLASRRIDDYGQRLRADLDDGFENYFKQTWPDGLKPAGTGGLLSLTVGNNDPAAAKKRELVKRALDIIASQRDQDDLSRIRKVLDEGKGNVTAQVISFFKTLGDSVDIERLGRTPPFRFDQPNNGNYFGDFIDAARLILRLHKGDAASLLNINFPAIMKAKLIELMPAKDFSTLNDDAIVELLLSSEDDIRRATARKVPTSVVRRRVTKIMDAYRSNDDGRYYIVTHWLDLGLAYDRPMARRVVDADARR
ncbi:DUF4062 domain-containing protein [Sphingomonas carotinifaciens]|uniref:DUF4062 domain-containing protein n=1 Tax=Sphingomonas carotinifaciens TaxID=1166323 RepID=UPI0039A2FCE5